MKQSNRASVNYIPTIFPHPLVQDFPELLRIVEGLSDKHKRQLVQKLIGDCFPLNRILGRCNLNNCLALKLDGNAEKISEQLEKLPPETVQALVEGVALLISPNRPKHGKILRSEL